MAITYEIHKINPVSNEINVKYVSDDESLPAYWTMASVGSNLTEEQIHNTAKSFAEDAVHFWQDWQDTPEFVMEEYSRSIKDMQIEASPEYDPIYEYIQPVYTEDETTIYKSWEKVPYSAEQKALNIRARREKQLQLTDFEAVSDRTISQEMIDYRQALRDITDQETFPNSVIWPIKPIG